MCVVSGHGAHCTGSLSLFEGKFSLPFLFLYLNFFLFLFLYLFVAVSDHPGRIGHMIWVESGSSGIGIPVGSFVSPVWLSHMVGWGGLQQSGATLARGCCTGVAGSSGCDTGVVEPGFITEDLIV